MTLPLAAMLQGAVSGETGGTAYVDDVFSTYLYTGNGSTQTITNGIDLAGKGGLVWTKTRSGTATEMDHQLMDSVRGFQYSLESSNANANFDFGANLLTPSSTGFSLSSGSRVNQSSESYASWTFRKAAKFFDVVTYTGNGSNRTISHSLGQAPGMIVVKCTSNSATDWAVYHRGIGATKAVILNGTDAAFTISSYWNDTEPTSSVFSVGTFNNVNTNGYTYVAYLFAHDTGTDGIIQCGSFTTDGSGKATVNLGWEPQFVLVKKSSGADGWYLMDNQRGFCHSNTMLGLQAQSTQAESAMSSGAEAIFPTATGFTDNGTFAVSSTFIYLAIRRPNKPPTSGTQVYCPKVNVGTSSAKSITGVGFPPDMCFSAARATAGQYRDWMDRLRGPLKALYSNITDAETTETDSLKTFDMDGISVGADATQGYWNNNYVTGAHDFSQHFFRRAPGVFDVVCYTGTGSAVAREHALTVSPEFIILKDRSSATGWRTYCTYYSAPSSYGCALETNAADTTRGSAVSAVSVSTFTPTLNTSTNNYVAYLFATKAGISKVGAYTGNGSSQTINCGFAAGARFFLVKATSTTGSWWVFDSARGVIAAADPALQLNSTAAEVTSADAVDPDNSGIIVNQEATCSINANGVSYVYLAFS